MELIDGKPVTLPPLAGVAVSSLKAVAAAAVTMSGNVLDNGRVRAEFAEDGRISAMSFDGKSIPLADAACGLVTFPDHPANYDAWDVDRPTLSNGTLARTPVEASFGGDDSRRTASFTRKVGDKSTATIRYILEAASPVLRIEVDLDWQDRQTLLKIVFPTQFSGKNARYGAPYGSALRPQIPNTIGDGGMFENPASRWVCVSDDGESAGLCVVTEDKYGVGCEDGLLHLSLVRSAKITHADDDVKLRDFDAYGGTGHTPFSDLGKHTVRLAVGAFSADRPRSRAAGVAGRHAVHAADRLRRHRPRRRTSRHRRRRQPDPRLGRARRRRQLDAAAARNDGPTRHRDAAPQGRPRRDARRPSRRTGGRLAGRRGRVRAVPNRQRPHRVRRAGDWSGRVRPVTRPFAADAGPPAGRGRAGPRRRARGRARPRRW